MSHLLITAAFILRFSHQRSKSLQLIFFLLFAWEAYEFFAAFMVFKVLPLRAVEFLDAPAALASRALVYLRVCRRTPIRFTRGAEQLESELFVIFNCFFCETIRPHVCPTSTTLDLRSAFLAR